MKPIGDIRLDKPQTALILLILSMIGFWFSCGVGADPDLWGHTRFGLDHIQTGVLAKTDDYSFTASGRAWTNHEWLTELIFGYFYLWKQAGGLFFLHWLLLTAVIAGIFYLFWFRWPHPVFAVLLTVLLATCVYPLVNIRPHSFTYLLTIIFLILLDEYKKGNKRLIFLMPPLEALWANLHGGFIVGLGIATIGFLSLWFNLEGGEIKITGPEKRRLVLVLLTTYAATLLNPYGLKLFSYLWMATRLDRHLIVEWGPIQRDLLPPYLFFTAGPVILMILAKNRPRAAQTVFFFISAVESYLHCRFFALLALFAGLVLADSAAVLWNRFYEANKDQLPIMEKFSSRQGSWILLATISLTILGSLAADVKQINPRILVETNYSTKLPKKDQTCYPANAVSFLKLHDLGPHLALPFNWGEYAIWHLTPQYKVSIDGRYETVYDVNYVHSVIRAYNQGNIKDFLPGPRTDVILIENHSLLDQNLLKSPVWIPIYRDELAVVYVPRERISTDMLGRLLKDTAQISKKVTPKFFP